MSEGCPVRANIRLVTSLRYGIVLALRFAVVGQTGNESMVDAYPMIFL